MLLFEMLVVARDKEAKTKILREPLPDLGFPVKYDADCDDNVRQNMCK